MKKENVNMAADVTLMSCLCQCAVVKICMCFCQRLVPLWFFVSGVSTVSSRLMISSMFQFPPNLHLTVSLWLWRVEDKVLCAVGVLWPPAHVASWWSGAKKTCSSLYKTEKTSELCCHKSMKAFLRERSRRWEKLPRLDSFAFTQTDSYCQPSKTHFKKLEFGSSDWMLCLNAVLPAAALIKQFLNLAVKYVGEK